MRVHTTGVAVLLLFVPLLSSGADTAKVSGCLQRAPASVEARGRFMLTNASNSPLGGDAGPEVTPAEPARGSEPIEHRPGQSDARQETGGVSYLLLGGSGLESKVGQRVEVEGMVGPELHLPPKPTTARPMRTLQVTNVRAIASQCDAPR